MALWVAIAIASAADGYIRSSSASILVSEPSSPHQPSNPRTHCIHRRVTSPVVIVAVI